MTKFQQADEMDASSILAFVNDSKSCGIHFIFSNLRWGVLSAQEANLSTFDQSKAVIKQCQDGDFTVHVTVANALMAPVVEVGLDLILSPSWHVVSPIATRYGR